jgi:hypothetical protein
VVCGSDVQIGVLDKPLEGGRKYELDRYTDPAFLCVNKYISIWHILNLFGVFFPVRVKKLANMAIENV